MTSIQFSQEVLYDSRQEGIELFVYLASGEGRRVKVNAKLDTGSTHCVFHRHFADELGFNLESGDEIRIRTATGSFSAYGHLARLSFRAFEWEATVYFADVPRNILGRIGRLDRLRVGLIDHDSRLLLSRYDD